MDKSLEYSNALPNTVTIIKSKSTSLFSSTHLKGKKMCMNLLLILNSYLLPFKSIRERDLLQCGQTLEQNLSEILVCLN